MCKSLSWQPGHLVVVVGVVVGVDVIAAAAAASSLVVVVVVVGCDGHGSTSAPYVPSYVPNGAWSLSRCVAFRHDVRMSQSGLGGCWPDRFPLIPHHGRAHARAQIHPHAHAHAHAPTPTPTPSPSPSPSLGWPPSRTRPARMCGAVGLGCWRTWTLAWVTSVAPRVVIAPRRDG